MEFFTISFVFSLALCVAAYTGDLLAPTTTTNDSSLSSESDHHLPPPPTASSSSASPRIVDKRFSSSNRTKSANNITSNNNNNTINNNNGSIGFARFQHMYLVAYLLAVTADWLQGPYVYALYSYYGYVKREVGFLYIAGFASSAVFGTFIASLADTYGRKRLILIFCVTYAASCLVKHSPRFDMLLIGRILGGIAYSILFSVFESWVVHEHAAQRFDPALLSDTFGKAQFWNGVVAIAAGQAAGFVAGVFQSKVAPFDAAALVLGATAVVVGVSWGENYGDRGAAPHVGLRNAVQVVLKEQRVLLLGVAQSCFESAMFTFTFLWTPVLQERFHEVMGVGVSGDAAVVAAAAATTSLSAPEKSEIPHGVVFSTYMAMMMVGSKLFVRLLSRRVSVSALLGFTFVAGVVGFGAAAASHSLVLVHAAFIGFELACGMYFPAISTLRAELVPPEQRAAILSLYRVPLNVLVVLVLYADWPISSVCALCAALMLIGLFSVVRLVFLLKKEQHRDHMCLTDADANDPGGLPEKRPAASREIVASESEDGHDLTELGRAPGVSERPGSDVGQRKS